MGGPGRDVVSQVLGNVAGGHTISQNCLEVFSFLTPGKASQWLPGVHRGYWALTAGGGGWFWLLSFESVPGGPPVQCLGYPMPCRHTPRSAWTCARGTLGPMMTAVGEGPTAGALLWSVCNQRDCSTGGLVRAWLPYIGDSALWSVHLGQAWLRAVSTSVEDVGRFPLQRFFVG